MDNINVMGQLSGVDQLASPFVVFPNPSKGQFTISHTLSNPDLSIFSADGRVVFHQILQTEKTLINLDVKSGVYILHVNDGVKTYIEKITIK
jgi:hypothetical protein